MSFISLFSCSTFWESGGNIFGIATHFSRLFIDVVKNVANKIASFPIGQALCLRAQPAMNSYHGVNTPGNRSLHGFSQRVDILAASQSRPRDDSFARLSLCNLQHATDCMGLSYIRRNCSFPNEASHVDLNSMARRKLTRQQNPSFRTASKNRRSVTTATDGQDRLIDDNARTSI